MVRKMAKSVLEKRQKEQQDIEQSNVLGVADIWQKNSAREFAKNTQSQSKFGKEGGGIAFKFDGLEEAHLENHDKNKIKFTKKLEEVKKQLTKYDKKNEDRFYEEFRRAANLEEGKISALSQHSEKRSRVRGIGSRQGNQRLKDHAKDDQEKATDLDIFKR